MGNLAVFENCGGGESRILGAAFKTFVTANALIWVYLDHLTVFH